MNREEKSISQEKNITDTTKKEDSNIQEIKLYFDFIDRKINDKTKDKMQEKDKDLVVDQIKIINGNGEEKGTMKKLMSKSLILKNINEIKFENIETSSNYKSDNNSYSFKFTKTNNNADDSRSKSYYYIIYLFIDEKNINCIDDNIQSPKGLKFIFNLENDMRKVEIESLKNEISLLKEDINSIKKEMKNEISLLKEDINSIKKEMKNDLKTIKGNMDSKFEELKNLIIQLKGKGNGSLD